MLKLGVILTSGEEAFIFFPLGENVTIHECFNIHEVRNNPKYQMYMQEFLYPACEDMFTAEDLRVWRGEEE